MLKRWDTKNYDLELILTIFDSIDVNIESMNIPKKNLRYKNDNKGL